jgi:enamine deaminase RidA (YjgF/YER057c/UK114 family)
VPEPTLLPPAPSPQGRYLPAIVHGGVAYTAGMTPRVDGVLVARGSVGAEISAEQASELAGLAASNALSAIAAAVGGVHNVVRCLRLTVYIAAAAGFTGHSSVADGATIALRDRLGERGSTARTAIGVAGLPGGAPIEVELTAAVRTAP